MTHAQAGGRAFLYRFDATPPGEFAKLGASHGFDEAFVWNQPQAAIGGAGDGALAGALSSALLSFTRDASPGWSGVEAGSVRVFGSEAEEVAVDRDLLDAWTGVERR